MGVHKIILSCFMVFLLLGGAFAQNVSLKVQVEGISENRGSIFIAIYNNEQGFNNPQNAFRLIIKEIEPIETEIVVEDLPYGRYAIALFQDLNDNKTIDRNLLGIPTEKYGFSRDARRKFSPPSYEECAFTLSQNEEITITIK